MRGADIEHPTGEVTRLLRLWVQGEGDAAEELFPLIYGELRLLSGQLLRRGRPADTLQPTELVHEVYLRLVGSALPDLESRRHFFGIAARAMRQLLVEHARARSRAKRPTSRRRVPLDDATVYAGVELSAEGMEEVLAVHAAIEELARAHPRHAHVAELRYFAGFTLEETAEILGVGRATVARDWGVARALLLERLDARAA